MTVDEKLIRAAEHTADCALQWRENVPVIEKFRGQTVCDGVASIFDGPASRVYAWAVNGDTGPQYIDVKGGERIDSLLAAVRAWLGSRANP
jgi:hypothetical protein